MEANYITLTRALLLALFLALLLTVALRLSSRMLSHQESPCNKDDNYYFKDPINHPYDCSP